VGCFLLCDFILVLVGTVIGGGFASGREIGTYFMKYEEYAYVGMTVFAVLFLAVCVKVCRICKGKDAYSADEFYSKVFGNKKGKAVSFFTAGFSFIVFCSMISAMASLIAYYIDINSTIGRMIISVICGAVLSKGFSGVKFINYILVPMLVLGIVFTGNVFSEEMSFIFSEHKITGCLSLLSSIIYTCYNIITVVPAVVFLSEKNDKKTCVASCVFAAGILFLCAVSVGGIIKGNYEENMAFSIPIIKAIEECGYFVNCAIILSVVFSMATTAAAAGCWVNDFFESKLKKKVYVYVTAAAFVFSFFDFSVFVDRMYFVFGAAALYEVCMILKY